MGKTHKEQQVLAAELAEATKHVTVGARYRHYKAADKIYLVKGLGFLEATDEICVLYDSLYGERLTFIRPLSVWLEQVDWEGQTVPRFTLID